MADAVDLPTWAFETLRSEFFDDDLEPRRFRLRPKAHTQDDPFDEFVRGRLETHAPSGTQVLGATGPLISPDIVFASTTQLKKMKRGQAALDPKRVVGVEVKKLNRSKSGRVARPGGLDFNTTPPCRSVTVYRDDRQLEIPGFYLFACLQGRGSRCRVTALVLATAERWMRARRNTSEPWAAGRSASASAASGTASIASARCSSSRIPLAGPSSITQRP
ncbi:MAG: hypothetical protein ACREON_19440 [Gemmatimonadaceae bacterium]